MGKIGNWQKEKNFVSRRTGVIMSELCYEKNCILISLLVFDIIILIIFNSMIINPFLSICFKIKKSR